MAFVGNTLVDLKWSSYAGANFLRYVIKISGRPDIHIVGQQTGFYRVTGLANDTTYTFELCMVLTTGTSCSPNRSAKTGEVQGTIYQDLTWPSDIYSLHGAVVLKDGAELTIESGCLVKSSDVGRTQGISSGSGDTPPGGGLSL